MSLIVQKFGGSSVANAERVMNVASIVTDTYAKGNDVVVVVSAQGDTTDDLIEKANEINPKASKREKDMLLAAGEQISISLLAMAIEKLGYHAVSLLGWQAGFNTTSAHTSARIRKVEPDRIKKELDKKNIVIVAGFQGISKYGDITTLGRGGSDTSAVAIVISLAESFENILKARPGIFGTPITEILATSVSLATPLINIFSILVFSFTIVPEAFVILESTSSSILYFLAISTERLLRT